MKWLISFCLLAPTVAAQDKPPELLVQALQRLPGVSLLNPSRDLPGGYTVDQLKAFGYWPAWTTADLNHDGRQDVVATVVKRSAKSTQFGVIAVHAGEPETIHWVVPLGNTKLNGAAVGGFAGRDTVTPLYCLNCDALAWYRWSGQSYELELYAVGESTSIATYPEQRMLKVFASPSLSANTVASVPVCTDAKVLQLVGTSRETRWYQVEVLTPKTIRGWVPASFTLASQCIG